MIYFTILVLFRGSKGLIHLLFHTPSSLFVFCVNHHIHLLTLFSILDLVPPYPSVLQVFGSSYRREKGLISPLN